MGAAFRGESPASGRRMLAAERKVKVFELRKAGRSFEQIGVQLGITRQAASKACHAVLRELKGKQQTLAAEMVALEMARLDALLTSLWVKAQNGHLESVDRILKIMERRSKLLGLDAPVKSEATVATVGTVRMYLPDNGRGTNAKAVVDGVAGELRERPGGPAEPTKP